MGLAPYVIEQFMGLDLLDAPDSVPPAYSPSCDNIQFTSHRGLKVRPGTKPTWGSPNTVFSGTVVPADAVILDAQEIRVAHQNRQYQHWVLTLAYSPSTDKRFIVATLTYTETNYVLLTLSAAPRPTQLFATSYGTYVYIFVNDGFGGTTGVAFLGPFVWDVSKIPTIQVDPITIDPPAIGAFAAADSVVAGSTTVGVHKISVVFVSRTGFVSRRSAEISFNALNTNKIRLTNIPTLPAYTDANGNAHVAAECASRWIIMSEAALTTPYKAAAIADNTTTTLDVNIGDAQLRQQTNVTVNDTYLSPGNSTARLMATGAGVIFNDRMAMIAPNDSNGVWAANTLFISEPGQPQTFRGDVGFMSINIPSASPLRAIFLLGVLLYVGAPDAIAAVQDTGGNPSSWLQSIVSATAGVGSFHGVTVAQEQNIAVILNAAGVHIFNGSRLNQIDSRLFTDPLNATLAFRQKTGHVYLDSAKRLIYIMYPPIYYGDSEFTGIPVGGKDSHGKTVVRIGDYRLGFDETRWTTWTNNLNSNDWAGMLSFSDRSFTQVFNSPDNDNPYATPIFFITEKGKLVYFDDSAASDFDTGTTYRSIDWTYRFAAQGMAGGLTLLAGIYLRAVGSGSLALRIYDTEGTLIATPAAWALSSAPVADLFRGLNIWRERVFVEIGQSGSLTQTARVAKAIFMMAPDGERAH